MGRGGTGSAYVPRRAARRRRDPCPPPARGRRRPRPSSCVESRSARGGWWRRRRGPPAGGGTLLPSWTGRERKGSLREARRAGVGDGFRAAGRARTPDSMR